MARLVAESGRLRGSMSGWYGLGRGTRKTRERWRPAFWACSTYHSRSAVSGTWPSSATAESIRPCAVIWMAEARVSIDGVRSAGSRSGAKASHIRGSVPSSEQDFAFLHKSGPPVSSLRPASGCSVLLRRHRPGRLDDERWGRVLRPRSDTYGYATRVGLHGNHPVGGVLQRHAEVYRRPAPSSPGRPRTAR